MEPFWQKFILEGKLKHAYIVVLDNCSSMTTSFFFAFRLLQCKLENVLLYICLFDRWGEDDKYPLSLTADGVCKLLGWLTLFRIVDTSFL